MKTNRLKGKSLWEIKTINDNLWYWEKLIKLREDMRDRIQHRIGNGENTFLWMDNWHPVGSLLDKYDNRIIDDSSLRRNAKMEDIINGKDWKWSMENSVDLIEVKELVKDHFTRKSDILVWTPSPNQTFSISSA